MKFADLHLHTVFSDGTYTPLQIINASARSGLSAIAVVDHDTVEAIEPAKEYAKPLDIEVLPGIELSAEHQGQEVHILGYLIDYNNLPLREKLSTLKANRVERIYKITDKLKSQGLDLDPKAVFDIAGNGTVGRLHVARALLKQGKVSSIAEAFQKYIGDKCPAFYLGFKLSVSEAVGLIREAKGIPVLAHPYTINDDNLLLAFIDYGIMGLEAYYPEHSQSMTNFYLGIAEKHNLLVTGGSDFHGDAKPQITIGSIKIPYELVEKLKQAKAELK